MVAGGQVAAVDIDQVQPEAGLGHGVRERARRLARPGGLDQGEPGLCCDGRPVEHRQVGPEVADVGREDHRRVFLREGERCRIGYGFAEHAARLYRRRRPTEGSTQ